MLNALQMSGAPALQSFSCLQSLTGMSVSLLKGRDRVLFYVHNRLLP